MSEPNSAARRPPPRSALCVHHDPDSALGLLGSVLSDRGFSITTHSVGTTLDDPTGSTRTPDLESARPDLVVVMGSRWSVTDPRTGHWVRPELEMLRAADRRGVPVLGLCFGAQLLAAAHGGSVRFAASPEIGWYHLQPVGGARPLREAVCGGPWFEWHGDCVEVPPGATVLATTDLAVQAFVLRRNLALQFHPEVDHDVLALWLRHDRRHLVELGVDVDALLEDTEANNHRARRDLARLFDTWWSTIG